MNKVKWYLGEFFVVVCAVLVAFILNSWWIGIKEKNQEEKYLAQIDQDSLISVPAPHLFKRPQPVNWQEVLDRESFKVSLTNLYVTHQNLLLLHSETIDK